MVGLFWSANKMIEQTFNEIKQILSREFPELVNSLNPPATEEEIKKTEEIIGLSFPDDLKILYLMHNGQKGYSGLFFGLCFIDLETMVQEWQSWHDVGQDDLDSLDTNIISIPYHWIKEKYVNNHCIAISKDGGGNNIVIDLAPDESGISGQVTNYGRDEDIRYVIAPSVSTFFDFILTQVKSGNFTTIDYDEHKIFSLKEPENTHFHDALKHFDLPHGLEFSTHITTPEESMPFVDWYNQLDPNWQDIIKKNTKISDGFSSIHKCYELNLMGSEVSDLTPISKFVSLRKLILTGLPIKDISPLQGLKYLKSLYVGKTKVLDLAPIQALHDLVYLSLNDTNIDNIDELLALNKLKELNLEGTNIGNLDAVSQMENLHFLSLQWNKSITDLSPLANVKNLKRLNIADTKVSDISFSEHLNNLQELTVYNTKVTDFKSISTAKSLKFVTCSIEDFYKIKEVLPYKIRFAIAGEMSEKHRQDWESY